ncbi:uncharacterized protein PAC_10092 [Phialocephala subalpina]|uniref:Uncharacterized protein n=1 Tax=Phialocephala subalpina TaxID=576137 RepID=A0A1L7X5A1_9HELO|nr:uncharacterized protein PAC_10092 [Phialocephala subalpina]
MDISPLGIIRNTLPQVPLIIRIAILAFLGRSPNADTQDVLTEIIAVAAGTVLSTPTALLQSQTQFKIDYGVWGRMWITQYSIPVSQSDSGGTDGAIDAREAIVSSKANPCVILYHGSREPPQRFPLRAARPRYTTLHPRLSPTRVFQTLSQTTYPATPPHLDNDSQATQDSDCFCLQRLRVELGWDRNVMGLTSGAPAPSVPHVNQESRCFGLERYYALLRDRQQKQCVIYIHPELDTVDLHQGENASWAAAGHSFSSRLWTALQRIKCLEIHGVWWQINFDLALRGDGDGSGLDEGVLSRLFFRRLTGLQKICLTTPTRFRSGAEQDQVNCKDSVIAWFVRRSTKFPTTKIPEITLDL